MRRCHVTRDARQAYLSAFSASYGEARARFRTLAAEQAGRIETHPIGLQGPDGAELTIDVALFGAPDAACAVVVSSGLHGVEGFFGSAVQVAYLEGGPPGPPRGVGLVLIHALNPYGFAHVRRFDDQNIDPNRNFLLPGEPFAGSPPHYVLLDPLLNKPRAPSRLEPFLPWALWTIARHGMPVLRSAIAGGQYDYPRGLFFGGHGPSRTRRVLEEHLPRWIGPAHHVVQLDLHTGIGPWGSGSLLLEPELDADRVHWWRAHFPADRVHQDPPSWSYHTRGNLCRWCRLTFADRRYDFATAEFGTYRGIDVLAALRLENQAHHWDRPDSPARRWVKRRVQEVFVPASPRWRITTVSQALDMIRRALAAVTEANPPPRD